MRDAKETRGKKWPREILGARKHAKGGTTAKAQDFALTWPSGFLVWNFQSNLPYPIEFLILTSCHCRLSLTFPGEKHALKDVVLKRSRKSLTMLWKEDQRKNNRVMTFAAFVDATLKGFYDDFNCRVLTENLFDISKRAGVGNIVWLIQSRNFAFSCAVR